MRIDIDGAALADALANGAYESKSTLPVIGCALIEAMDGQVRLLTTDTEAFCSATIKAKVTTPGRICATADLLKAAAREGSLKLTLDAARGVLLAVPQSGSKLRIPTLPAEDFPVPDEKIDWQRIEVAGPDFARAVRAVSYAAATGGKFSPNYFSVGVSAGTVAATNGHRGAIAAVDYSGPGFIIPSSQVHTLLPLLAAANATVELGGFGGRINMVRAVTPDRTCTVRLIEGTPLDCRGVLLRGFGDDAYCATFDRAKLLTAIKQFLPFCSRKDDAAILRAADGAAQIADATDGSEENCSWALGELVQPLNFPVRLDYLATALGSIDEEKVRAFVLPGPPRLVLQPVVKEGEPDFHVIAGVNL